MAWGTVRCGEFHGRYTLNLHGKDTNRCIWCGRKVDAETRAKWDRYDMQEWFDWLEVMR